MMKTRGRPTDGNFVESQRLDEIADILRVISNWMAIPLFALFWAADILYVPDLKYPFLVIRALAIPVCLAVSYLGTKMQTSEHGQRLATGYAICLSAGINLMIYLIPDPATGYYAGLNLVAMGALSFIPLNRIYLVATAAGIYGPYYAIVILKATSTADLHGIAINSFFIFSSVCMCFLIRFFHEATRTRELQSRLQLRGELESREQIIRDKTEEAVRLNALSSQFSPQVVESIRSGKLKLESGGQRAPICAIFVDIVNSTEKVTRIDKDKVEKVLSRFLDDTIKILLKYDITIDKFLGDGLLGFCNAPLRRTDYVQRVVSAALEIRDQINASADFYERYWLNKLSIRVGIAKGFVNVGFYGSQKYYRSYTAIGPAVNLASRLCGAAEPNQIVTDYDVFEDIETQFETTFVGKKTLKGFNDDVIHVYQINGPKESMVIKAGHNDCSKCGSIMALETNRKGQFVFQCKACGAETELPNSSPKAA